MRRDEILFLFDYNRWANAKILAACRQVIPDRLLEPVGLSFDSLMGTLAHILGAEMVWRRRLESGISLGEMPGANTFPSLEALADAWGKEEAAMQAFIETLSEADCERRVRFTRINGEQEEATIWKALLHVVFHGMQFRGEAGVALAALGHSPGDIDLVYYTREKNVR